jgi:hypothetical protein
MVTDDDGRLLEFGKKGKALSSRVSRPSSLPVPGTVRKERKRWSQRLTDD